MTTAHAHHFIVDTPNGAPTVTGRCRECGEVREYPASSYGEMDWGHNPISKGRDRRQQPIAIKPREPTRVFGTNGRINGRDD